MAYGPLVLSLAGTNAATVYYRSKQKFDMNYHQDYQNSFLLTQEAKVN